MSRLLSYGPCYHTCRTFKVNCYTFEVKLNISPCFVRFNFYFAVVLDVLTVSGAPSIFTTMGVKINISADKQQYVAGDKVKGIIHVHVTSVSIARLEYFKCHHILSFERHTSIDMVKRRHHRQEKHKLYLPFGVPSFKLHEQTLSRYTIETNWPIPSLCFQALLLNLTHAGFIRYNN